MLTELAVGLVDVHKLELEVSELGTDPGIAVAERFQRRRTRLRSLSVRITQPAIDERVAQLRKQLAGIGVTQLAARLNDGYVSVRARAADGLATAELTFHIQLVGAGAQLRALASSIRVHGQLPTPGPVIADRLLAALLDAGEAAGADRPYVRGLCDVEVDLVGALLWHVLPPNGWRLPAVSDIELTHIRVARAAIEIAYGPAGTRGGELGVRPQVEKLAAAHDVTHSTDQQLRSGQFEDAMRGYRALLVSSGPDQPLVIERILALAAARPSWFFDGLELARQALGRWPRFAPAHAALASITLAQGDAREAARHLEAVARMASADGDDDQVALAALAAARLLRVLDPRVATQLYELALEHDASSTEAADSLADRLADEQRWPELVRLLRARGGTAADPARAVQLHLRLADVYVHRLDDRSAAQQELTQARELAPDDPAVHEMTATILTGRDRDGAMAAWREVARLADLRGDHRMCARAWARLGDLLVTEPAEPDPEVPGADADPVADAERRADADPGADAERSAARRDDDRRAAEAARRRALELDPLQSDALVGLAGAAAARNDHGAAADLYERLRGLGLSQQVAARHELGLARSLVALARLDDARASLRRATLAGGETAAEAHAMLAEIADAALDRDLAAAELDTAIAGLVALAAGEHPEADRLYARAAELAVARAMLFDKTRQSLAAEADWQRAHALARQVAPEIARDAARTLLARSGHDASLERRWIDAVLATRPPQTERAALLVRRADVRRRERAPDLAAALADLHEAIELTEDAPAASGAITETRRRAYQLEAQLFAQSGDQRSRAQALAALARLAERASDRVASETAAAAAWLAADEPAAALPHGARAHASLATTTEVPAALRREVLVTLGEAAWRQRAWPDVVRAYRGLLEDPGAEAPRLATFRYRLAVAADRVDDPAVALAALRPLVDDADATRGASPELRGQALRLFAELAERAGELVSAASALEAFALIGGDGPAAARADAVVRAGELFRRVDHGDDAIRCFETSLRIADAHMPALDALEAAWRERGDLERVAAILGRKVAATARHPGRQKPLLSRLADLQDQLGRPDVAHETHQRALEIDPMWRPSLRYITLGLRGTGQVVAAAGGLAQLAGELHGDSGVDLAIVTREREIAAEALSELVIELDDAQLDAVRTVALPALERAALDNAEVASGLARLRGDLAAPAVASEHSDAATASGRIAVPAGAQTLRDAAGRARLAGKLDDAFATLETANHVHPGDVHVLRELVELATLLQDHTAAVRHLGALAAQLSGARRGDALLELADIHYDKLDDAPRGRDTMRQAAEAFGSGARRDATLRMLATEAASHLAWDITVEGMLTIPPEKRTQADLSLLATALMRAGRDADALASIEAATAARRFDDGGELVHQLQREIQRKIDLARSLEDRAASAPPDDAQALLDEAQQLRIAIGQPGTQPLRDMAAPAETLRADTAPWPIRTKTKPGVPIRRVMPAPIASRPPDETADEPSSGIPALLDDDDSDDVVADVDEPVTIHSVPDRDTRELAGAPPQTPAEAAASMPASFPDLPPPALGRIKLVPRPVTRPGIGVRRDGAATDEESDGGWQSVSNPSLRSDPAIGRVTRRGHELIPLRVEDRAPAPETSADAATAQPAEAPAEPTAEAPTDAPADGAADSAPDLAIPIAASPLATSPSARFSASMVPAALLDPDRPSSLDETLEPASEHVAEDASRSSTPTVPSALLDPDQPDRPSEISPAAEPTSDVEALRPSVTITGTPEETALAVQLAAASADRDRLLAARRAEPDDASVLLALLAHLGDREPALLRDVLDEAARTAHGRALAIALHEAASLARESREPARAQALWARAYQTDPSYPPVWMPLADALAASDDTEAARELYEAVVRSDDYDATRRAFAADRAEALGRDDSVVSGEIKPPAPTALEEARRLADAEDWPGAIAAAERAAAGRPDDPEILELLERIYLGSDNVTAASEAVGRQLLLVEDPAARATLWRRRARIYRDAIGRDAEVYRCLEEAHRCAPADPDIAYQLRTAAMVRGDWPRASQLLYREIAAASHPRDRGALHLELALIYEERLDDAAQAQTHYEQALAFDPTIPAVKVPLARRYEVIGRSSDAARLYEEAAASARAADRASLLEAAARCRATAAEAAEPDLAAQLDRAEAAGDLDAALDFAHQLWRADPGHPAAFRVLANLHRTSGDLVALTELTSVRASRAETPDERATAWLEVARLAEDISALDQAARAYDLALIEDPGHVSALDARGALAFRLADFATADLIYRDLGTGESVLGDDELALRRSIIAEQLGRDSDSLHLAQTAAALAPGRRDLLLRVQELATRIGELPIALTAARQVLELVPLDDDEAQLAGQFGVVELLRESGHLGEAVAQLERILRDHPMHAAAIEALAQIHIARGDWPAATRYLYQLVPLAPSPGHRAERLYQLGEAVLVHVKDLDRADDAFLRASDLDPGHVPTLRRLLDVYWRADDPGGIVEVATELADKGALVSGPTSEVALARALVAAALVGDTQLAQRVHAALGDEAASVVAHVLAELAGRSGRLQLSTASTAVAELARRGLLDLAKLRAAAAGTAAAKTL